MALREEKDLDIRSQPYGGLESESPYLEGEIFLDESGAAWEPRYTALEAENPFQRAFEDVQTSLIEPEEMEEEFSVTELSLQKPQ